MRETRSLKLLLLPNWKILQDPKKALEQRLIDFEGYWQAQLGTIHPKGLNIRNELKRSYYKYNTSF